MLITEKDHNWSVNAQARLTPLEEREEPEKQYRHEFQFHQRDIRD